MSKFEEYDLYVQNKDFLAHDSVITFNDTDGRLLALKPDVTLSIIKNTESDEGCKHRVYYNESVYRVSGATRRYKEIMQTGIECIGDTDISDIYEVVSLAAKSLATLSESFAMDISHMGILSAILDAISPDPIFKKELTTLISEKNRHEALALCKKHEISDSDTEKILSLVSMYGTPKSVLPKLLPLCETDAAMAAYGELSELSELISESEYRDFIKIDFSVINDMNYYNGVVFKGFLPGICEDILSGGEYGKLVSGMGKRGSAVGFAICLDPLSGLGDGSPEYDVDTLILYSDATDKRRLIAKKRELSAMGRSFSAQRAIPKSLRYREILDLDKEGSL